MDFLKWILASLLAPFVKGSSKVIHVGNWAIKVSDPKPFVRLLYLFFYGTLYSPYETIEGMRRAFYLRRVANHVTLFYMGREVFAKPVATSLIDGKPTLITEWICGRALLRREAHGFLKELTLVLSKAGLPTWSVTSPLAYQDLLECPGKSIVAVDFESVLPNIFAKESRWGMDPVNTKRLLMFLMFIELTRPSYSGWKELASDVQNLLEVEWPWGN